VGAFAEARDVVTHLDLEDLVDRAGLTARELEAFELREQQDMSYAEIAAALDVAEGTVGALLSTARRKLKAEADKNFSDYRRSA
jgi:RNA polymerase sigma factor (sigma-70 family)